jgi:hypothetical protein
VMNLIWAIIIAVLITLVLMFFISFIHKLGFIGKKKRKIMTMDKLESEGKTGDLILYSGETDYIVPVSWRKAVFPTEITHVGVLYFKEETIEDISCSEEEQTPKDRISRDSGEKVSHSHTRKRKAHVWESTIGAHTDTDSPDVLTGKKYKKGPQLRELRDVVEKYGGYLIYIPLYPSFEDTLGKDELERRFQKMFKKYSEYSFDTSYYWLGSLIFFQMSGVWPLKRTLKEMRKSLTEKKTLLCSELVMRTYKYLGMWGEKSPKNGSVISWQKKSRILRRKGALQPLEMYFPQQFYYHGHLGTREWKKEYELRP